MIKSEVVKLGVFNEFNVAVGAEGFEVSVDSNTPWISIISEVFREISSSWTLVPYG